MGVKEEGAATPERQDGSSCSENAGPAEQTDSQCPCPSERMEEPMGWRVTTDGEPGLG